MENLTIKEKLGYGFDDFASNWGTHIINVHPFFYKLDDKFLFKIIKELTKKREA